MSADSDIHMWINGKPVEVRTEHRLAPFRPPCTIWNTPRVDRRTARAHTAHYAVLDEPPPKGVSATISYSFDPDA